MKKVLILILIIGLFGIFIFVIKNRVGDLRPVFLPPIKTKPKNPVLVKRGKQLDFDIKIADGFQIGLFAEGLNNVRDITFSPGGTLIASVPSLGKIIMLPDRNHDGIADGVDTIISGLQNPHGVAFYKNALYVAEEKNVSRYFWADQKLIGGVARLEKKLFDLPKGGRHFTRSIAFKDDGTMYVSIGSTCDVCHEAHDFLAAVIVSDFEGKQPRLFAKGLRNSPFIIVNSQTQALWGTEMGRDFLGDTIPPDEINIIQEGKNYGWPNCYGNKIHDTVFDKNQYFRDPCIDTIPPVFPIAAHSAPLGLRFITSEQFPKDWQGDLLVAYHGSWNRSAPIGYEVVRMFVDGNTISGEEYFISGFLQNGSAVGRPVDLEFDPSGNLYISDDKGGNIFIVSKK